MTRLGTDPALPQRRPTALVVDDEHDGPQLARYLRRGGYDAIHVGDLAAARVALAEGVIDVVVTDLGQDDGLGFEILELATRRQLPVVMATKAPDPAAAARALQRGVVRCLTKPVSSTDLLDAVTAAHRARARLRQVAVEADHGADAPTDEHRLFDDALEQLFMVFQPIVSWGRSQIVAFEALMRSRHPTLGRPDLLLAAAERLGRVHELGRTVRARVAERLADLPAHVDIYVNLHASELADPELAGATAPLARHANRVVFEITERAAIDGLDDVVHQVSLLRALGYRIAVDDLGAGYASLSLLAMLRPDLVKLDMSLVQGARSDPMRRVLLNGLSQLVTRLGLGLVAEGVETIADLTAVVDAGADLVQGYLFARPSATPAPIDFVMLRQQTRPQERMTERLPQLSSLHTAGSRRVELARDLCQDAHAPLLALANLAVRIRDGDAARASDQLRYQAQDLLALTSTLATILSALTHLQSQDAAPPAAVQRGAGAGK